jgi:hypothetical protein
MQTMSTIRRDSKTVIAACRIVALEQHVERHDGHDGACAQLHFNICKEKGQNQKRNAGTEMHQT